MSYAASEGVRDRPTGRAAIFVDYEDIFRKLSDTTRRNGEVGALISEMIEALKKSLLEERQTQTAVSHAYADFTELNGKGDALQRALYLQGVESRFVPQSLQANAVEIQLCVDAMDLLHHRADINTFVLLTGSRSYLPLIQHFKRYGHRVLIVALEEPPLLDQVHHVDGGWFFDARDLLSSSGQRVLTQTDRESDRTQTDRTPAKSSESVARSAFPFKSIEDPILIQALEIIEEHFGQYEEVYLTPLLRKMSEVLEERTYDPKEIISDLEDSRAVRLEKRQGFPHDYTVLIVERDHPDVERVQQELSDRSPYYFDDVRSSYDEDETVFEVSADGRAGDGRADDHPDNFDDFDAEFDVDVDVEVDVDFQEDGHEPELEQDTFNDSVRGSGRRR